MGPTVRGPKGGDSPVTRRRSAVPGRTSGERLARPLARRIAIDVETLRRSGASGLPSERVMMERYAVGRGTLREALRILEVQGLVVPRPGTHGGTMVGRMTSRQFARLARLFLQVNRATYRELVEARVMLEPEIAALASDRGAASGVISMVDAARAADLDDDGEYLRTSYGFHDAVAGAAGNVVIDLVARALRDVLADAVGLVHRPPDRGGVRDAHERVAAAVGDHDAEAARAAMRDDMVHVATYLEERYPALLDSVIEWR